MKKTKPHTRFKSTKTKTKNLFSPRGMRDIINEEYYSFQGFFEKAQEVAVYYGFKPIETPMLEHVETFTSGIGKGTDIVDKEMYTLKTKGGDHLALKPEHTAGLMRSYIEKGMQNMPQPVMFYQYGPVFRHDNPQRGRYRQFWQFDLDSLGSDKSIVDALVIKVGMSILEEAGAQNMSVDINSIGDKECRNIYIKELTSYYRKHINGLAHIDRERLKTNPLRILDSKEEKTKEINENAPDSISFLCASCKKHFKEVLEYLEEMNIGYNINKNLVRGLSYYTRTVFEIIEQTGAEDGTPLTLAGGGRYDYLAHQIGGKKDVPAVGFSIGVDRIISSPWYKKLSPRIFKKPKICFIQLGSEAKLKSLNIIEILRKAHIPITQSISKDSLGSQLAIAEKLNVPYALIFGVKEAIDDSVIVRDMSNRSQETVKLKNLLEYLKEIK
ncbi:MAG: Histidine-tRNA ligase [Candidatus Nomurabacteria bacterium GW2011_GWF2_35_12]|uniref:Histidine--tRNA ligase n=2 Tax=Candidatus Nomuraibacteriota TaxID=1752729 RepID=A0A0G0EBZ1_9BACT|nr:MAG: Histidine-tRNA ligase [Candidatus Nomurabacteria bacterium GW2011_GWF2_35_12]KKP72467.1 MAG: Histidine-tRNA ligase [Candidatus Nomurabacteria bacterium GW2011_GWB1_35_20]KKP75617.1 MAG: Histidine-tRNA ligase [Parcubacteria group bacterium GW2011_GWC1_35_21]KKP78319.1 MAG: Histidine-tRNA ligase [Candidatus Nomurabacteria bacterium GW2011_GWC2_35_35]KKP98576.1 MAG: Histidine-tRNA ligase [Candidatus Nomurabacteria bacterium GW2011_GWA1_36_15]HCY17925.1 histidine--tRNA ligase [Candidatus N